MQQRLFRIESFLSACAALLIFWGCNSAPQSDELYVSFDQWLKTNVNFLESPAVDSSSSDVEFQTSRLKALLAHVERGEFDSLIAAAHCERQKGDRLESITILFLPVEGEIVFATLYVFLKSSKNLVVVFKVIDDSSLFVSEFSEESRLLIEGMLENAADVESVSDRPVGLLSRIDNEGFVVDMYRYDLDGMNTLIEGGPVEQVDLDCE